ncbi:TetR/AcrR family transcriptional regulator [Psychromonas aquimarina]|uniref:TetR/AcrR family transcriptional regulator n=1 Tax=Psychromonas aquimarina TaxID=444919 RepID=UPI000421A8EB|nr:TetR/AcrR family transcriptional regulator [Psychromonas aquimarina]
MKEKKLTRSQFKHASIIRAAMLEFQDKGFKAAGMDDIAKRAEVSKRTVYNHFASKELLFEAILEEMLTMLCAFEHVPFSLTTPLEVQLRSLADKEIALLKADGFLPTAKVILGELMHSPELMTNVMQTFNKQESPLAAWFNEAYQAGVLKCADPEIVVTQFIAVIKGFCFWPQLVQGQEFPNEQKSALVAQTAVEMILKQYT